MVPRHPEDESTPSDHEAVESAATDLDLEDGLAETNEEFHTDDDDDDNEGDGEEEQLDNNGDEDGLAMTSAPLLPKHLLHSVPTPDDLAVLPLPSLTRRQKRAQSALDRRAKRQMYARIRNDARGSGVLEAGTVAQIRRQLTSAGGRVATGRVQKTQKKKRSRPTVRNEQSGRQERLAQRKRVVEEEKAVASVKRVKTKSNS